MDLLNVANGINIELNQLRMQDKHLISEQERAEIFNSVVTALSENLIELLEFSIRDIGTKQTYLNWGYDLSDNRSVQRKGPQIREITIELHELARRQQMNYFLDCRVRWSDNFQSLNPRLRKRILESVIWDEQGQRRIGAEQIRILSNANVNRSQPNKFDIRHIEHDLHRLQAETRLTSRELDIPQIIDSVNKGLVEGSIIGVVFLLLRYGEDRPLLEWRYSFRPGSTVLREGKPIEQIIEITNSIEGRPWLSIEPILSEHFRELPPASQHSAMHNTIWSSKFQQKPKKRWL